MPVGILHYKVAVPSTKGLCNRTCVYEGEYVHIEGKRTRFALKQIGSPLRKAGKSRKKQLVFMKGNMCT